VITTQIITKSTVLVILIKKDELPGSADFLGTNAYTSTTIRAGVKPLLPVDYSNDMDLAEEQPASWEG